MAIDVRPKVVDIAAYAGNTLTIKVTVPAGVADGYVWTAQIRADRSSTGPPDATFIISEPVTPGGPAFLTLKAADSSRLAGTAPVVRRRDAKSGITKVVKVYTGQWDCQAQHPTDPDPVYTFVQGGITLDLDVTR